MSKTTNIKFDKMDGIYTSLIIHNLIWYCPLGNYVYRTKVPDKEWQEYEGKFKELLNSKNKQL